ncbi:ribonuclease domain-containing protein [uncultured Serinicoccus sp.]|uniref:ribonuclease domain-containing protein n=1 Tax=uncultured Serinicoccus sp. TaxID=735514 RepID=UPI002605FE6C|nr:ribonuclease domain-containing protein [uncultured Serinicoccus sp.]
MTRSWVVSAAVLALLAALVVWLALGRVGGVEEPSAGTGEPSAAVTGEPAAEDAAGRGAQGTDTRAWDDVDACTDGVLPPELEPVVDDVEEGGPYAYPERDGSTFRNQEGLLPQEERGYYREFTVQTPGLSHRGAKRVVTGGDEVDPEVWYYTDDHYESFCEFAPAG